jgi:hypothetical protein
MTENRKIVSKKERRAAADAARMETFTPFESRAFELELDAANLGISAYPYILTEEESLGFDPRIGFTYFECGGGRVTVAFQVDAERGGRFRSARYFATFCSPKDMHVFSKRKGRFQAISGLLDPEKYVVVEMFIHPHAGFYHQITTLLQTYARLSPAAPRWAEM